MKYISGVFRNSFEPRRGQRRAIQVDCHVIELCVKHSLTQTYSRGVDLVIIADHDIVNERSVGVGAGRKEAQTSDYGQEDGEKGFHHKEGMDFSDL